MANIDLTTAFGCIDKHLLVELDFSPDRSGSIWRFIHVIGVCIASGGYSNPHFLTIEQGDEFPEEVFFGDIKAFKIVDRRA